MTHPTLGVALARPELTKAAYAVAEQYAAGSLADAPERYVEDLAEQVLEALARAVEEVEPPDVEEWTRDRELSYAADLDVDRARGCLL